MIPEPIAVIGIGPAGAADLSPGARAHIEKAGVLAGGRRHLDYFPEWVGERIVIDGELSLCLGRIAESARSRKTVVLASGDPLYFGIGRALLDVFTKDELIFYPHLSSVQLAFARLKESWHDACVLSLHGRPMESLVPALQRGEAKIALLTDATNNPQAICTLVCEAGYADQYALWVCEDLGGPAERITQASLHSPPEHAFGPLNIVVLLRWGSAAPGAGLMPVVGIPDESLKHREGQRPQGGLITKREVRLLALCQLELRPYDVLWDVGAGSGSVALEAARLSSRLTVHAVEKDPEACSFLAENLVSLGLLPNVHLVHGEAPEGLMQLPDPDAVFIGGSGGRLVEILACAMERLRTGGRLVLNCITLESLSRAWTWLDEHGLEPEVLSVQLARSRPLGSLHCLEPESPISIIKVRKR
jgi:precorrin-6Y C5,15-methyltransferase (decarboxylating)